MAQQPLPAEHLPALREALELGHYRGVLAALDRMLASQPDCQPRVEQLREQARQFQFEAMLLNLEDAPC